MSIFKFGNFEVEFDPTEIAFVEKYETAAENYKNKIKDVPTEGKASKIMKTGCAIFFETFDGIFGKGTSKKMFGDLQSVDLCVKAFKLLIEIMNDYSETLKTLLPNTDNRVLKRAKKKAE